MDSELSVSTEYALDALCQALRANWHGTTDLHLYTNSSLCLYPSTDCGVLPTPPTTDDVLIRVGQAIRGNTFVRYLRINVTGATLAGVRHISHFIAASPTISRLYILSDQDDCHYEMMESAAAVRTMLAAASISNGMHTLSIPPFVDAKVIAICLQGMRNSLVSLELSIHGLNTMRTIRQRTDDAATLGLAVASLRSLREMSLACCCDEISACFLDHLGPVLPKLRKLMLSAQVPFHNARDDKFSEAIEETLQLSGRLETIYFDFDQNLEDPGLNESAVKLYSTVLQIARRHKSMRVLCSNIVCEDEHILHVVNLIESNNPWLEGIQVVCRDLRSVCQSVAALENNKTIKSFEVQLFDDLVGNGDEKNHDKQGIDDDTKRSIAYYTCRNTFVPALAVASKTEMVAIFDTLKSCSEATSIIFETLRVRDSWYESTPPPLYIAAEGA